MSPYPALTPSPHPTGLSGADSRAAARCAHCGTPVEGAEDSFCCAGCELAFAIIRGAGLEHYYEKRTAYSPRPAPLSTNWNAVPVVQRPDGSCEARLVIDDIRCASCVWLIERVLEHASGVEAASVSYATGRTSLRWRGNDTSLDELAQTIARLGYRPRALEEASKPDRTLLVRLGVAAFAAMNLMLIAASIYAGWLNGMEERYATLLRWVSLVLATPVALWCAAPFFTGAIVALQNRLLHIDLPVALGVAVLYGHGLIATLLGQDGYFDSLGMLVALLLAGRLLEARGRRRAAEAATALVATLPRTARRIIHGNIQLTNVGDLAPGDLIDVPAGDELPADGVIVEGAGELRVALLTGEAMPVPRSVGDTVMAGTVLVRSAITVEVRAVGERTIVHAMAAQIAEAGAQDPRPTSADRIAPWFTAATLLVACATFFAWVLLRDVGTATLRTVAVLVVACPCALALSQPLATAAGLAAAARRGLLLRSSDALLDLADVDVGALDKTGTITEGDLMVISADDDVLRIAAALERQSSHPIARAILREAARREIPLPRLVNGTEIVGVGVRGTVDGCDWVLRGGPQPGELHLLRDGDFAGVVRLGDCLRKDSVDAARALETDDLRLAVLTGDSPEAAHAMARAAGIETVIAQALPGEKAEWITHQQSLGHRVLFVGDGVNDSAALARADVGIAMSTGAASSVLIADGVISTHSLLPLLGGRRAARASTRVIRQSQRRSVAYNILAVTAAAVGWVNPLVAAILMPLSSGMVIWASTRVERIVRREEAA
ncbi:MAG TPA: heavy metal translocating P-type ATPase metal-binding domain-containing protein [Longimicrobiales bacterium]